MWVISNHFSINLYVASCHHAQLPKCALPQLLKVYQNSVWTFPYSGHTAMVHMVSTLEGFYCVLYMVTKFLEPPP